MSTNFASMTRPDTSIADLDRKVALPHLESPLMSSEEAASEALGVRVRRDEAGSNAEVGRAHVEAAQGGNGGPLHIHLHQEERFIVHTGELLVRRGRERLRIGPGEEVPIQPKVAHTWRAQVESTFTVEFRPTLTWELFMDLFALPTGKRGNPRLGDLARLARAYPDEFLYVPYIPISLQRALAVPLSKLSSPAR